MNNSETVYNGNLPFIFVSYAHLNSKVVLPLIKVLSDAGYRIWFDQGIEAGTEWSNNIAAKLRQCSAFIFFVSKQSVESENCLDEVAYAKANKKPSLLIFLEDNVVLPEGTDMQTARFQRMYMSRQQSLYDFINNFSGAKIFNSCKDDSVATQWQAPSPEKFTQPQTTTQNKVEDPQYHTAPQTQQNAFTEPAVPVTKKKIKKGAIAGIIISIVILIALAITLITTVGSKGGAAKKPEDAINNFMSAVFEGDMEGIVDCLPEELVDYMIESSYNGDRDAFLKSGEELFGEELDMITSMNIEYEIDILNVNKGTKQDVKDIIDEIDLYYDVKLDIEEIAYVEFEFTMALGEIASESESDVIDVVKIDGKWYLLPEALENLFV